MNSVDEMLVRNQMAVYVDITLIIYDILLEKLQTYSEITVKQRHQIAGELAHALTLKTCINENSEDITYYLEKITNKLEQSAVR